MAVVKEYENIERLLQEIDNKLLSEEWTFTDDEGNTFTRLMLCVNGGNDD